MRALPRRRHNPLSAVAWAFVRDVADIVRIEAVGSTPLVIDGSR
jgi:hypothetical protein